MDDRMIVMNFAQTNRNFLDVMKANHKINGKIRGLRAAVFVLGGVCGYLLSELQERKRSEKYLEKRIDEVNEFAERIEKTANDTAEAFDILARNVQLKDDGGVHDA